MQRCISIAAIKKADEIQEKTTIKMLQQEKDRHAKGGLAKGAKNKLFKETVLKEYEKISDCKTIKEFVYSITDRLNKGEFDNMKPHFVTTTPEATIRNWITEYRKKKTYFK